MRALLLLLLLASCAHPDPMAGWVRPPPLCGTDGAGCVDVRHVHPVGTPDLQTDPDVAPYCLVLEFDGDGGGELVTVPCTTEPR